MDSFESPALDDRKAQYAAWKERLMNRRRGSAAVDLEPTAEAERARAMWSTEALFGDAPADTDTGEADDEIPAA